MVLVFMFTAGAVAEIETAVAQKITRPVTPYDIAATIANLLEIKPPSGSVGIPLVNDHFRSLHTFLTYQGNSFVDYVGKLEHLDEDWQPLKEKFGLDCPQTVKCNRRVSGPAVPFRDLPYTMETAEVAINRYARDIELYGYRNEIDTLLEKIKKIQ
ncbi:hypothetical protein KAI46_03460 [bacterium]|nr:hypothetical protein [bacterium]